MPRRAAGIVLVAVATLAAAPVAVPPDRLRALAVRRGSTGVPATLGEVLGDRPALVSFWATWCAPCRAEVPVLRGAAARFGGRGLRVVGVAVDHDAPERVARAAADWGIDYDVVWVPAGEAGRLAALVPAGLPATFVVGPAGVERLDRLLAPADVDRLVPPLLAPARD